jgi:tetraprenyl-beta-curcumene synthase
VFAQARRRVAIGGAFASAASIYWLDVFPHVGREVRRWRRHAQLVPDPVLRKLAIDTHYGERLNAEGATAFAILAPHKHRPAVVQAIVAFQAIYEYVDTLAEQPCRDPVANGHRLHGALLTALDPARRHSDYYEHSSSEHDCRYMRSMVDTCRRACASLPSYPAVADAALQAAERIVTYQSLVHGRPGTDHRTLASWSDSLTPRGSGLRWWETASSAASSLGIYALIAAAARPALDGEQVDTIQQTYFPWIGALHLLLDSLVDRAADEESGHHNLVEHYSSTDEAASRLGTIAFRALQATETVPGGVQHAMILAAMASFYLSTPAISTPGAKLVARRVLRALGSLAKPTMAILRARRVLADAAALPRRWGRRAELPRGRSAPALLPQANLNRVT